MKILRKLKEKILYLWAESQEATLFWFFTLPGSRRILEARPGGLKLLFTKKGAKLIYQDDLLEAQEEAKKEKLGVWGK